MTDHQREVARAMAQQEQHQAWLAAQQRPHPPPVNPGTQRDEWAAYRARMAERINSCSDPIERLLLALTTVELRTSGSPFGGLYADTLVGAWERGLSTAFPGLALTYRSDEVARWFGARAVADKVPAAAFALAEEKIRLFRHRVVSRGPVPAWCIEHAVSRRYRGELATAGPLYVLPSGRMFTERVSTPSGSPQPSLEIRELEPATLIRMALFLHLEGSGRPRND